MKRIALLLTISLLLTAGCDSNGPDQDEDPLQDVTVRSFILEFDLQDASFDNDLPLAVLSYGDLDEFFTPSVVDKGAVMAYYREAGTWTALPTTFAYESNDLAAVDYSVSLNYAYDDDLFEIFYEASDEVAYEDGNIGRLPGWNARVDVKVVIIEGFPTGRRSEVDLRDYEAVRQRFDLEE